MKKQLVASLAVAAMLGLTACGNTESTIEKEDKSESEATTEVEIAEESFAETQENAGGESSSASVETDGSKVQIGDSWVVVDRNGTPAGWYSKIYDIEGIQKKPPEEWCTNFTVTGDNEAFHIEAKPIYIKAWNAIKEGSGKSRQIIPFVVLGITNISDKDLKWKIKREVNLKNGETLNEGGVVFEAIKPGETIYKCPGFLPLPHEFEKFVTDDDCLIFEIENMKIKFDAIDSATGSNYCEELSLDIDYSTVAVPDYLL